MQQSLMTWSKEVNDYVIPPGFAFALAVAYVIHLLCYPSQQNRDTITAFLVSARQVYVGCNLPYSVQIFARRRALDQLNARPRPPGTGK
jgi:hypothetical protein